MDFFVDEKQRKASNSTLYFEFQQGHYHDKYWLPNSISIHARLWEKYGLSDLICPVIEDFDYYGMTEVTKNQWDKIITLSQKTNPVGYKVLMEAASWADECFEKYDVFTIIGI